MDRSAQILGFDTLYQFLKGVSYCTFSMVIALVKSGPLFS